MKRFSVLIVFIFEPLIRVFSALFSALSASHYLTFERKLRGFFYGLFFGSRKLSVGRVVFDGADKISLGRNVKLYCDSKYIAGVDGWITIGSDTHIGFGSVISGGGGVDIGERCAISSSVFFYSVSNDVGIGKRLENKSVVSAPIKICDDVFIGAGVVILPGVVLGRHAVIAAGSVVTNNVEPGQVVAGVPAKPIGK